MTLTQVKIHGHRIESKHSISFFHYKWLKTEGKDRKNSGGAVQENARGNEFCVLQ